MSAAQWFLALAGLYGASGVALGAFGAHGLKARLGAAGLATWETAVHYHLFHALALVGVALWLRLSPSPALTVAGWSFAVGVLLFSGSLYALALDGPRLLGPVTPLGGVAFIAGWLALSWAAVQTAASPP